MTDNDQQLEITKLNGRTQIVFKKAQLKGKVSAEDVLNTILIAARMQAEKYIEKLQRAPLDVSEVKALKELAEITKAIPQTIGGQVVIEPENVQELKATLYQALSEKLSK